MFKISHEVPLELLSISHKFNDYDYALVHLFDKYPQYYKFYKDQLEAGRGVILDNSAYELGQPYDWANYKKYILSLRPTEYILPDYRDDAVRNIGAARQWFKKYPLEAIGYSPITIGVVHGKTYEDFIQNYKDLSEIVDKLAFSFESFFNDLIGEAGSTLDEVRVNVIARMVREGVIDTKMPHHILGALSPTEYKSYVQYDWIESADTSNPILHGLIGQRYSGAKGLEEKSKIKMEELMEINITQAKLNDVRYNVEWFRAVTEGTFTPELKIEAVPTVSEFNKIAQSMSNLLEYKNAKYGNAALDPMEVFQGKCKVGQRLDDKLARIKNGDTLRKNDVADMIGYLMLACVENGWTDFEEFMD